MSARSMIHTQDGTVIVFDPEIGTVSAKSEAEAWREVERRKALKTARRA